MFTLLEDCDCEEEKKPNNKIHCKSVRICELSRTVLYKILTLELRVVNPFPAAKKICLNFVLKIWNFDLQKMNYVNADY